MTSHVGAMLLVALACSASAQTDDLAPLRRLADRYRDDWSAASATLVVPGPDGHRKSDVLTVHRDGTYSVVSTIGSADDGTSFEFFDGSSVRQSASGAPYQLFDAPEGLAAFPGPSVVRRIPWPMLPRWHDELVASGSAIITGDDGTFELQASTPRATVVLRWTEGGRVLALEESIVRTAGTMIDRLEFEGHDPATALPARVHQTIAMVGEDGSRKLLLDAVHEVRDLTRDPRVTAERLRFDSSGLSETHRFDRDSGDVTDASGRKLYNAYEQIEQIEGTAFAASGRGWIPWGIGIAIAALASAVIWLRVSRHAGQ